MEIGLYNQPNYFQNTEWFPISALSLIQPPKCSKQMSYIICTLSFFLTGKTVPNAQEYCFIEKKKQGTVPKNMMFEIKYYEIHNGIKQLCNGVFFTI
jgi:hypothetical protein